MDFETQRMNMVESQVRPSDVTDRRIIAAMSAVPREAFVPEASRTLAYMDEDLRLSGAGSPHQPRALMAPRTFAKLLQLARIEPGDFVLDAGSATGYSTAVIARLGASAVALECDARLADEAKSLLARHATNVTPVMGELAAGYPEEAPYDVIVLEGAVPEVPRALLEQLKDGGRLVAVVARGPLTRGPLGKAVVWTRNEGRFAESESFDAAAPTLPGFEKAAEFAF
jgi:protein-L-isoaspartate(D-aspartate) O-methyltransferase